MIKDYSETKIFSTLKNKLSIPILTSIYKSKKLKRNEINVNFGSINTDRILKLLLESVLIEKSFNQYDNLIEYYLTEKGFRVIKNIKILCEALN